VIGVHRCSLVVDGQELAAFAEATVVGAEIAPPERPTPATATLRGGTLRCGTLPDWPATGRSCFLILYAATGTPVAKYWLAKARPSSNTSVDTVLTCDYIQSMAP
jgi:hypothetical protein